MELTNQNDVNINYSIDENTYKTNFINNSTMQNDTPLTHIPLPPELNISSSIKHLETDFKVGEDCKGQCRQDACNMFIDEYKNKPQGINFI